MSDPCSYSPNVGDIWCKDGPVGWAKVIRRMWPGFHEYDGGLRGASVRFTNINGNWTTDHWFIAAATPDYFAAKMKGNCRYLVEKETPARA